MAARFRRLEAGVSRLASTPGHYEARLCFYSRKRGGREVRNENEEHKGPHLKENQNSSKLRSARAAEPEL